MVWPPLANTFVAFKKSDIRMPESSIRIRSAAVMPLALARSPTPQQWRILQGPGLALPVVCTVQYYSLSPFTKVCIFVKQTPDGSRSACSGRFRSFTIASSNSGPSGSANRRCTKIANKRSQIKDFQFGSSPLCRDTPTLSAQKCTLLWPNYTFTIYSWQDRPVEKSPSHY